MSILNFYHKNKISSWFIINDNIVFYTHARAHTHTHTHTHTHNKYEVQYQVIFS